MDPKRRIERIWRRFGTTHAHELREALILEYLPLVHGHAKRLAARLPQTVAYDDLVSVGTLGLLEAIETFDVGKGTRFETYCARKIPGAMLDELRALDWAPRQVRARAKMVAKVSDEFRAQAGRAPTEAEVASRLGMPEEKCRAVLSDARPAAQVSFSAAADGDENPRVGMQPVQMEDRRVPSPQEEVERAAAKEWLMRGLSRCERLVLILYYYEGLKMREVGLALGISESRVSQMRKGIVKRLRARLRQGEGCEAA